MRTGFLRHLYDGSAPFITVWIDTTYDTEDARRQNELRWRGVRDLLVDEGAAPWELRPLDDAVRPGSIAGDQSQLLVEAGGQVVLAEHLPLRPAREIADRSALPHLLPWLVARSRTWVHPYLLVLIDRNGADIELFDLRQRHDATSVSAKEYDAPIEKNNPGGWSQSRYQRGAHETWQHNTKEVAAAVEKLRRRYRPDLVVVSGDMQARALLLEYLPPASFELTVEAGDIDRAAGASEESLARQVGEVLELRQDTETELRAQHFEEARVHDRAVEGLDNVVGALARGGVETLLLNTSQLDSGTIWTGPGPLQVALRREDMTAMGLSGDQMARESADDVVVRALVMNDGELVSVDPDRLTLRDGVGAVLRYTNQAAL